MDKAVMLIEPKIYFAYNMAEKRKDQIMVSRYGKMLWAYFFSVIILLNGCIPSQISHKAKLTGQIDITDSIPMGKLLILNESVQILFDRTEETISCFEKFYTKYKVMESNPSEDIGQKSFSFENDLTYNEMKTDLEFRKNALRILEKYTLMLCAVSAGELNGDIDKFLVELAASIHHFASLPPPSEYLSENYSDLFKESMQVIKKIDSNQKRADVLKKIMDSSHTDVNRLISLIINDYQEVESYLDGIFEKLLVSVNQRRPVHEDYYDPLLTVFDSQTADMVADYKTVLNYLKLLIEALTIIPEAHLSISGILGKKNQTVPELQKIILHIYKFEQINKKNT